jgi:hypothetical protein
MGGRRGRTGDVGQQPRRQLSGGWRPVRSVTHRGLAHMSELLDEAELMLKVAKRLGVVLAAARPPGRRKRLVGGSSRNG